LPHQAGAHFAGVVFQHFTQGNRYILGVTATAVVAGEKQYPQASAGKKVIDT
jgi:hypothetical protein